MGRIISLDRLGNIAPYLDSATRPVSVGYGKRVLDYVLQDETGGGRIF